MPEHSNKLTILKDLIPDFGNQSVRSLSQFQSASGRIVCETPEYWSRYVPFGMESALNILTRGLNTPDICISLKFEENPQYSPAIDITSQFLTYSKSQGPQPGILGSDSIKVYENYQGRNIGRSLGHNLMEFHTICGHHFKSYTTAGSENGGYTWAKHGLLPYGINEEPHLHQSVNMRLDIVTPLLSEQEYDYINRYRVLKDPKDIWGIADAEFDLSSRLLSTKGTPIGLQISGAFNCVERFGPKALKRLFEIAESGRRVSLGQFCLAATCWGAHIDYRSAEQMQRVSAYTGGFKYINFE